MGSVVKIAWQERIWSHIRLAPHESCWEWKRYRNAKGYGRTSIHGRGLVLAHRAAYESAHGTIPDGFLICHHCDNPACCRPDHLFLGTVQDNSTDMVSKGRGPKGQSLNRGEHNGMSKFTPDQIIEIRRLHSQGHSTYKIAKQFGVWNMAIWRIAHRKRWAHLEAI